MIRKETSSCLNVTPDSCISYVGSEGSRLDIKSDDSVGRVLDIILNKLEALTVDADVIGGITSLQDEIKQIQASSVITQSKLYGLVGGNISSCAATVTNRNLNYYIAQIDTGVTFTYSVEDMINSLPEGISVQSVSVIGSANVTSSGSTLVNSTKKVGGFTIPMSNLPASIQFRVKLSSTCGVLELYKDVSVTTATLPNDYIGTMQVIDTTSTGVSELTQDKYNELLASKLTLLESRLDSMGSFSDKTEVQALEIKELQEKSVQETTVLVDGKDTSLQASVTDLVAKNASLQSNLDLLKNSNESLKAAIVGLGGKV